jgi:hypothetical protein
MRLAGLITKVERASDDALTVQGVCSSEVCDSDGETVLASAMREALPAWLEYGNIREMHAPSAVGKALKAEVRDDGSTWLEARIIDPVAIRKCEERIYMGFSIGGRALERDGKIIKRLRLSEISIVDRPANPQALFEIAKAFGLRLGEDIQLEIFKDALRHPFRGDAGMRELLTKGNR